MICIMEYEHVVEIITFDVTIKKFIFSELTKIKYSTILQPIFVYALIFNNTINYLHSYDTTILSFYNENGRCLIL